MNINSQGKSNDLLTPAQVILIAICSIIVFVIIVICIKWLFQKKRERDERMQMTGGIPNYKGKEITMSINEMDPMETVGSSASMAFMRYETGGRTWIG